MATAHFSVRTGSAGKGLPHAEYISRIGKYAQRLEQGEQLEQTESGNMPKWAEYNPIEFWRAADLYERKNGTVYREHEIALPRELNAEQRAQLVREWVEQELGDRHAYTWAIHNKTALDGGEQPHVHLMFSERINDGIERDPEQYFKRYNPKHPERGGAKKHRSGETPTERKEALTKLRDRWERMHNRHIEQHARGLARLKAKISMKRLEQQPNRPRSLEIKRQRKLLPSESNALHRQAALQRAAAEITEHYDQERVNSYFIQTHLPTAQRIQQDEQERQEQQRAAEAASAKRTEREKQAERYVAQIIASWIENGYYDRDGGIYHISGGDYELCKKIWVQAKAANIKTSPQFDSYLFDSHTQGAAERKRAQLEAEAAGKGTAPEIAQAFQNRAERIAKEQAATAQQERQKQEAETAKQQAAVRQTEQIRQAGENKQPTQTQKGRGIRH